MAPLQKRVFEGSLNQLEAGLDKALRTDKAFLLLYRSVRQHAFELEFLGKFCRKSGDKKIFAEITETSKALEDRLGLLDEVDAMIPLCENHDIRLSDQVSGADHFTHVRDHQITDLREWMGQEGWINGACIKRLRQLFKQLDWLDDSANRHYARKHMADSLNKLQKAVEEGKYHPRADSGYSLKEVEPRVHKLRRDVRKQAQYLTYTGGLFTLNEKAFPAYASLLGSTIAKSPFARLPKARVKSPLQVPRVLFLAINRYVSELGDAKDWVFNLERLKAAGLKGGIDFDQLDVRLKNWRGQPVPFNALVLGILKEMRRTRLFARMADAIAES